MSQPVLLSIQVGMPRDIGAADDEGPAAGPWYSGFYKEAVTGRVRVGRLTVSGDGQADLSVHGGPDRPILAYCADHYPLWRAELGVASTPFGAFGENFTVTGLDEKHVCLGDQYRIGPVRVEVSQPRQPCWKLARRWRNKELPSLVIRHNRGGWYFRVLDEGDVEAGTNVELLTRPYPQWTVARANDVMFRRITDDDVARDLMTCPPLSADWRDHFSNRLSSASAQ